MEAPPCLTCGDNQTPCKDLAVGFSELDKEITTKAIEITGPLCGIKIDSVRPVCNNLFINNNNEIFERIVLCIQ